MANSLLQIQDILVVVVLNKVVTINKVTVVIMLDNKVGLLVVDMDPTIHREVLEIKVVKVINNNQVQIPLVTNKEDTNNQQLAAVATDNNNSLVNNKEDMADIINRVVGKAMVANPQVDTGNKTHLAVEAVMDRAPVVMVVVAVVGAMVAVVEEVAVTIEVGAVEVMEAAKMIKVATVEVEVVLMPLVAILITVVTISMKTV